MIGTDVTLATLKAHVFFLLPQFFLNSPPAALCLFVWPSSGEPGGTAADRGEAEGETGPLEVHQALENPLLHFGREPAALPQRQIGTQPPTSALTHGHTCPLASRFKKPPILIKMNTFPFRVLWNMRKFRSKELKSHLVISSAVPRGHPVNLTVTSAGLTRPKHDDAAAAWVTLALCNSKQIGLRTSSKRREGGTASYSTRAWN